MTLWDGLVVSPLREMRESIDNIDAAIVYMLAERFRCTRKVGILKAEHNLPPADPEREANQVVRLRQIASAAKLDPDFAERFHALVVKEVKQQHEAVRR
jgi:chorismate mutase